jgi:hypothetical protein
MNRHRMTVRTLLAEHVVAPSPPDDGQASSAPLVFINYRELDEPWAAAVLDEELTEQFGADAVFLDSRSVIAGQPFNQVLLAGLRRSAVLLVVIGARWLSSHDRHGRRLIDRQQDWVRLEIAEAFVAGLRVVPVLLGDLPPLDPFALPASIRQLARCQFVRLRHRNRREDLAHLVRNLVALAVP